MAGFDQRDVLLSQTGPLSQLGLRQAGLNSGCSHILAENLPQIVGNGRIALGRFRWRTLPYAAARASQISSSAIVWALVATLPSPIGGLGFWFTP